MIIGKYILLNLLVAIVIKGFINAVNESFVCLSFSEDIFFNLGR